MLNKWSRQRSLLVCVRPAAGEAAARLTSGLAQRTGAAVCGLPQRSSCTCSVSASLWREYSYTGGLEHVGEVARA